MRISAALVVTAALLAGGMGWARADEGSAAGSHRGTGIVIAVSPNELTMIEDHGRHVFTVDRATKVVLGAGTAVRRLGVGDYVAEECVPDGKGGLRAVKLVLFRPAWMELASPEN